MGGSNFKTQYQQLVSRESSPILRRPPSPSRQDLPENAEAVVTVHGEHLVFRQTLVTPELTRAVERLADTGHQLDTKLLFLDTETTGLAGGTGTYAFLVGIGQFGAAGFTVSQYLMRNPSEERAVLYSLSGQFGDDSSLVSYNGKAFDLPLLITRYRMHRASGPMFRDHVDLLPLARSIWKHRLKNCSLSAVEAALFNSDRAGDVPGWLIPQLYFDFQRDLDWSRLMPVVTHNRRDIVSLASLYGLVTAWTLGQAVPEHPCDHAALILYQLRKSPEAHVRRAAELWRNPSVPERLRLQLLTALSVHWKRLGNFDEAVEHWRSAANDSSRAVRAYAAEELAKYLEHRTRDYTSALTLVRQAADAARLARADQDAAAFDYRARRLERKSRGLDWRST